MSAFIYRPLEAHHIRLLHILPDSSLAYELVHTNVEDAPPYIALSCTWEDQVFPERILVDKQSFPVTENLYAALQALGDKIRQSDHLLWVDAICIDQQDTPKR